MALYSAISWQTSLSRTSATALPALYALSRKTALPHATRAFSTVLGQDLHASKDATEANNKGAESTSASASGSHVAQNHNYVAPHPGLKKDIAAHSYMMMHPVYEKDYLLSVGPKHLTPQKMYQKVGYNAVQLARRTFDWASGYGDNMDERKWLKRFIFLETVAGVPGMVGGMLRHMRSLRTMKRDHGWIHTLIQEAENERMHLLTFLQLREPGLMMRGIVLLAQGVFFNVFLASYLISPKTCHAFVGYLEEEAVKTYTRALEDLDAGKLPLWTDKPAPLIAVNYWKLKEDATMRDLLLAVRADEACHMHVNHTFSNMKTDETNPFADEPAKMNP